MKIYVVAKYHNVNDSSYEGVHAFFIDGVDAHGEVEILNQYICKASDYDPETDELYSVYEEAAI